MSDKKKKQQQGFFPVPKKVIKLFLKGQKAARKKRLDEIMLSQYKMVDEIHTLVMNNQSNELYEKINATYNIVANLANSQAIPELLKEEIAAAVKDESEVTGIAVAKTHPNPDDLLFDNLSQGGLRTLDQNDLEILCQFKVYLSPGVEVPRINESEIDAKQVIGYYTDRWQTKNFS